MNELNTKYWSERYQKNQTGWDLGEVSQPLRTYFDQLKNKHLRILIPGCGRGYEGIYLWRKGFKNVYFADFSVEAIKAIKEEIPEINDFQLLVKDFFDLDDKFDLIVEQTLFCAIHPRLREKYVQKTAELLVPTGKNIGLLFNRKFEGGPPFGGNKEEYIKLFSPNFNIVTMEDCYNSVEQRKGTELFFIAEKS